MKSFNIVLGAAPSGLEALRRLVRRWDPLSGGKRRSLLRQTLVPDRCKLQDLPAGLEKRKDTRLMYVAMSDGEYHATIMTGNECQLSAYTMMLSSVAVGVCRTARRLLMLH